MAQYDFGTIDPATKSGTALSSDLNSWRTAIHSAHKGSSRPAYAIAGTIWVDDSASPWTLKFYDGIDDISHINSVAVCKTYVGFIVGITGCAK